MLRMNTYFNSKILSCTFILEHKGTQGHPRQGIQFNVMLIFLSTCNMWWSFVAQRGGDGWEIQGTGHKETSEDTFLYELTMDWKESSFHVRNKCQEHLKAEWFEWIINSYSGNRGVHIEGFWNFLNLAFFR